MRTPKIPQENVVVIVEELELWTYKDEDAVADHGAS